MMTALDEAEVKSAELEAKNRHQQKKKQPIYPKRLKVKFRNRRAVKSSRHLSKETLILVSVKSNSRYRHGEIIESGISQESQRKA